MSFRTIALPTAVAEAVRSTRLAPGYGHPAHAEIAGGYGPCRHCLRTFRVGEERRILFTFDSFAGVEGLPLPGPVFIHEEGCDRFAEDGGFPGDLRGHALTLDAYARGREPRGREYVSDGNAEAAIGRLLARPEVDYIQVHDTEAGCYDLRIERASSPHGAIDATIS
jgi:hypothetical protein